MKPRTRGTVLIGVLLVALTVTGCRSTEAAILADDAAAPAAGTIASPDVQVLSEADAAALVFLREEEKLAHDVYVALYETWGSRIFENIAASETTHTEAVAALLADYGIADPAAGNGVGEFTDPELQALYAELVEQGRSSPTEALLVGAYIEEMDILDLRERATDVLAIDRVLDSLERGSSNHLRAFIRNLDRAGVDYTPELMPLDEFEEILAAGTRTGRTATRRGVQGRTRSRT